MKNLFKTIPVVSFLQNSIIVSTQYYRSWGRLSLFAFLAILIVSCSKEDLDNDQQSEFESPVKTKNGILVFDTQQRFEETLHKFRANNDLITSWKDEFPDYQSMLDATDSAFDEIEKGTLGSVEEVVSKYGQLIHYEIDHTGEGTLLRNVSDDAMAVLLNKDGMVQIENTIFKVNQDVIYQVDSEHYGLLKSDDLDNPLITSHAIERIIIDQQSIDPITQKNLGPKQRCNYYYNNKKKRLHGKITAEKFCPLACEYFLVVETLHQKKNFFGAWSERKTKKLRLAGSGYGGPLYNSFNFDTGYKKDKKRLAYVASICTSAYEGNFNDLCYYSITATNYCKCDNSVYAECTTEVENN